MGSIMSYVIFHQLFFAEIYNLTFSNYNTVMNIYLVGGAVRDLVLGLTPRDYDYCVVNSSPAELVALGFEQVGQDFPVFLHPRTGEEYALARSERKSDVVKSGFEVSTDNISIEEDLRRRDFTMNSMAIEVRVDEMGRSEIVEPRHIIDPYGGQEDLRTNTLRHTSEHFREDPLRILRGCRLAAVYNLTFAPSTWELIRDMVAQKELEQITQPRIFLEFKKAFAYPQTADFLNFLCAAGLQNYIPYLRPIEQDLKSALLFAEESFKKSEHLDIYQGFETQIKAVLAFSQSGLAYKEYLKNHIAPGYADFIHMYAQYTEILKDYAAQSPEKKLALIKATKSMHIDFTAQVLFFVAFCEKQDLALYHHNVATFAADNQLLKGVNYEEKIEAIDKKERGNYIQNLQLSVLQNKEELLSAPTKVVATEVLPRKLKP